MSTATILSWVLAAAPGPQPTTDTRDIATVDVERSEDAAQITGRDSDGEVAVELFLWTDGAGRMRFAAAWPDGLYLSVIGEGEDARIDTEDSAEVANRLTAVSDVMSDTATTDGWGWCAFNVASTVIACGAPVPIVGIPICAGGALAVACECLPLLDSKHKPEGTVCE